MNLKELHNLRNQILDISETNSLALNLCKDFKVGDVVMLKGELGVGKTTLSHFIINNLYKIDNKSEPISINSPTYPILLTYNLSSYQIYHYDLFRIKNLNQLEELDFYENLHHTITLIEWPELLIDIPFNQNYYLINMNFYSETKRAIDVKFYK